MSFVRVNDNLVVVEQSVKNENVVEERASVNHIWIYDRSGSMYGMLSELTEQLITLSRKIPMGDTLTIGWFSGNGQNNFILKGFKVSDESDYTVLENAIRKNNTTVGLTCFSEILAETRTVIEDLSVFSETFALHFFTDGYPNMDTSEKIFNAIKKIDGKISSAMLVGYGYYYHKELMTAMAEKLGAMLIHSSMIPEYTESITRLVELSGSGSPKQQILPPVTDPLAVFTVTDQGVILGSVNEETGMVSVTPQGKRTNIYYVSTTAPEGDDEIAIDMVGEDNADLMSALYASSLVLTQQMKTDVALEIIGGIGDKSLVDAVTNSFTIDEYGSVESKLEVAVNEPAARFISGKDTNYLPPNDAFCVFDVITKLMDDDEASFLPYHKGFVYNKVSKPTVTNDEFAKFIPEENPMCAMDDLVWHKNRLNLSVRAIINGSIDLREKEGVTASDVGLADNFPVFVYRNYTFIKDGITNVKKVYVSTTMETKKYFESKGIVIDDGDDFDCDGIYGLDLTGIPAINRALAEGNTSATNLCGWIKRDMQISGELKALKNFLKVEYDSATTEDTKLINEKQKELLVANGVDIDKGGVYSPKVDSVDSTDMYIAKKFDIKIKGLSSIPSVKKVVEKMASGKNRTLSESVVEVGITKYEDFKATNDDEDMRKIWLVKAIAKLKAEQKGLRGGIQKTKFAIILGKRWFQEFDSREDNVLDYEDWKFTFVLGEEAVKI